MHFFVYYSQLQIFAHRKSFEAGVPCTVHLLLHTQESGKPESANDMDNFYKSTMIAQMYAFIYFMQTVDIFGCMCR